MPTKNGKTMTGLKGLYLQSVNKGKDSVILFDNVNTAPTTTTGYYYLYVDSGVLKFDNGSSVTTVGSAGSSGGSLDTAYDNGRTITVNGGSVVLAGTNEDTAVLSLTGDGDSSGALISFTHTTATRNDVLGTGSTWKVTGQGASEFQASVTTPALVAYGSGGNANLTVDAKGTGTITLGATSTGAITLTRAVTATASITITGTADSDVFTVTDGDLVVTLGSLTMNDNDNAVGLKFTNNTATTVGASAATGLVEFASTSLTTGTLLHLELTEGTLNGGHYLKCWDVTAGAAVFSVAEDGATTIAGVAGSNVLTVTAGDVVLSDGSITLTDNDSAAALTVANNTSTTGSVVNFSSTTSAYTGTTTNSYMVVSHSGLTSGTLLRLSAAAANSSAGVVDIATAALTTGSAFRVTVSGATLQAGGKAIEVAMGAATVGNGITVTTTGVYTGTGVVTVVADSATTSGATVGQGIVAVSADALTTGTALDVTSTSIVLTTGRIADFSHISGNITGTLDKTGDFFNIQSDRTVTTGTVADDYDMACLLRKSTINGAGSFSATGSVLYVQNDVTNTSGTVSDTTNGVEIVMDSLGTGSAIHVTHSAVAAVVVDLVMTATTTGKGLDLSDMNALTTGIGLHLASSATGINGAGRLLYSNHTGATGTNAILNEFATAANDETVLLKLTASDLLAGGIALDISAAAATTAKIIDISNLDAITTGKAIHIDATGVTQTDGILVHIDSASTALTSTGRLLLVDHTGNAGVSAVIAEVASAAADETTIFKVTASAALAAGTAAQVSVASMTTGTALKISNADALTTGTIASFVSNSSDNSTRNLAFIHNDHASATGVTPLALRNDAPTSTNYWKIATFANGSNTVTLWMGSGTTANGNLSGTAGDIIFNGGSNKPEYCTGTTNWTALV